MKKSIKRLLSFALAFCLILAMMPTIEAESTTAPITNIKFNLKLKDYVENVYPSGSVYTASNDGGYQCFGFANNMAKTIFGSYPTGYSTGRILHSNDWTIEYGTSALNNLHIGDIVRFNFGNYDHSIFVTAISDDTITYSDANRDWKNGVVHNNTMSRSELSSRVSKLLNDSADVSGDYYG